jgi:hypothetical protein
VIFQVVQVDQPPKYVQTNPLDMQLELIGHKQSCLNQNSKDIIHDINKILKVFFLSKIFGPKTFNLEFDPYMHGRSQELNLRG